MTVLIVTGGYFPGVNFGGIATSRFNFTEVLGDKYNIFIVTRNHDYKTAVPYSNVKEGWNRFGKANVFYLSDEAFNGVSFGKIMDETHPDIVYASGTITTYFYFNKELIAEAKKRNIPVLITPDGDVLDNAMNHKRIKKFGAALVCRLKSVFRDVWFQATTPGEVKNLPKYLGIRPERITLIPNMPCVFEPRKEHVKDKGVLKVVFSGRIHPIKNLLFAIKCLCELKQNVFFDIYGSMEDGEYWNECKTAIAEAPPNVCINYKGRLDSTKAREIAKGYDCFFLPTVSENYGYVIEEALLCGCPVIISRGTTPWDDVHGVAGFTAELGDTGAFVSEFSRIAEMDTSEYNEYTKDLNEYIKDKLSYEKLVGDYKALFERISATKK